jgi:Ras-related protein Rab-21
MSVRQARRVVFIGEAGVGKTSIVHSYVNGTAGCTRTTLGADYSAAKVLHGGVEYPIEIWDTAGAERYRSIGPVYYRKASAAVAVFDLTAPLTLQELNFWISHYRQHSEHDFVVIVGNKSDADAAVSFEQCQEFAAAMGAPVIWTSAANGDRVADVFDTIAQHFAELEEAVTRLPPKQEGNRLDESPQEKPACC